MATNNEVTNELKTQLKNTRIALADAKKDDRIGAIPVYEKECARLIGVIATNFVNEIATMVHNEDDLTDEQREDLESGDDTEILNDLIVKARELFTTEGK